MIDNYNFNLYCSCIPVRGYLRSIIYDLERNRYDFIPNGLYELITADDKTKIGILNKIPDDLIVEYHTFLEKQDYLIDVGSLSQFFPKLQLDWDYPAKISNGLIELSNHTTKSFELAINQLNKLGCHYFQIIVVEKITLQSLIRFFSCLKGTDVREVQLILDYHLLDNADSLSKIPLNHPFCSKILIFSSPYSKQIEKDYYIIKYIKSKIVQNPGDPKLFRVNLRLFSEAKQYNTYFNRKIIIDRDGRIVPFLGSVKNWGYLGDNIAQIAESEDFKTLWYHKKDDISVCQDCEFRYMCVDNRVPISSKDDNSKQYSFKSPCTYDPYNATWVK